jgi:hypothetical protein
MRRFSFIVKPIIGAGALTAAVFLLASLSPNSTQGSDTQDLNFRLINIERRLDLLQSRVDFMERAQQNQPLSAATSNLSTQALQDLQRQQLSFSEQLLTMQKQMLELKKEIDRATPRKGDTEKDTEKKEPPKPEAKPKPTPKKP